MAQTGTELGQIFLADLPKQTESLRRIVAKSNDVAIQDRRIAQWENERIAYIRDVIQKGSPPPTDSELQLFVVAAHTNAERIRGEVRQRIIPAPEFTLP